MSKQRFINTKFWSDNYIVNLNPLERYLFLYFLTNEHTNISGIYELPLKRMATETGIDIDMLPKMLKRMVGKIYYVDGWVCIVNFEKHQRSRGSPKIEKGIELAKKEVPVTILDKFSTLISSLPIDYPYTPNYSDSDSDSDSYSDSDSDSDNKIISKDIRAKGPNQ